MINAIGFDSDELEARAQMIAKNYNLHIDHVVLPRLNVTSDKLVLISNEFTPLFVDFNSESIQKRRVDGKKQGLIRACKPAPGMRIFDATAGWGRDAAMLASFGATVVMIERQPVMAALLTDGIHRLAHDSKLNLSLLCDDAKHYLQQLAVKDFPDVIYIDPMHPTRQKSALVKKDMQILQQLIGADNDVEALIQLAIQRTKQRVVVKWPQKLAPVLTPNASITGKTVRFDIYT